MDCIVHGMAESWTGLSDFHSRLRGRDMQEIRQNWPRGEGRHQQEGQAGPEALSTPPAQELCQYIKNGGGGSSQQLFIQSKGDYSFLLSLAMENALSGHVRTVAPEVPY